MTHASHDGRVRSLGARTVEDNEAEFLPARPMQALVAPITGDGTSATATAGGA